MSNLMNQLLMVFSQGKGGRDGWWGWGGGNMDVVGSIRHEFSIMKSTFGAGRISRADRNLAFAIRTVSRSCWIPA